MAGCGSPFSYRRKNARIFNMKHLVLALFVGAMSAFSIFAQVERVPIFAQFRVPISTQKPKTPNLKSHKDARMFRTNLRNAAKAGVNFAGHYALTYWGCGASCGVGAIVDLKTGKVFFPDQLNGVWAQEWPGRKMIPFGFRKDSRMLVLHGYLPNDYNGDRVTYGYHYFVWNGSKLRRVKFVPKDWRTGE